MSSGIGFKIWAAGAVLLAAATSVAAGQGANPPSTRLGVVQQLRQNIDTGHADEALKRIAVLRTQGSTEPGLSGVEGLALYTQGNLRGADEAFRVAMQEDASDLESVQMRGLTLFRLGRPADAIPLLEASKAKTDGKSDPNYVLGLCYMDTRKYDEARRSFAAQYGFAPDSAPAYLISARMMLRRESLPIAKQYAEKALTIEPTLPLAHELMGEIELAGNHLDEAIREFEAEKKHNPLEGSVYDRLGDAYVRAAKYDEAERSLQEALLLEPNATGPYILLGKTLLKKGDPLGAETYLQRANALDPANYMTHSLLSQAYRAMGRKDDATRENETAQKIQTASEPKLSDVR